MPRKAFTLLEICLVVAIMAILVGIAYPSLDAMYGGFKITAATDTLRAAWAEARARSVNEGRSYRFSIVPGKGNFRIAPDDEDLEATSAPDEANVHPLNKEDTLPDGVALTFLDSTNSLPGTSGSDAGARLDASDANGYTTAALFLPDGTCQGDVELLVECKGTRSMILKLRGLTGVVYVRPQ